MQRKDQRGIIKKEGQNPSFFLIFQDRVYLQPEFYLLQL